MEADAEYEIIDFKGYMHWIRRDDGIYAVDPLYLDAFKKDKGIK